MLYLNVCTHTLYPYKNLYKTNEIDEITASRC